MKKISKLSLQQLSQTMPKIDSESMSNIIGCGYVVVNVNRLGYGDNSTQSHYMAIAYDDNGNFISAITGVFLEPGTNYEQSSQSGSNTAINPGSYYLVRGTYKGQTGYYQVDDVEGRTGIMIHTGNIHGDTTGCLLPGNFYTQDSNGDYSVWESKNNLTELTNFFDKYGDDYIKINFSL